MSNARPNTAAEINLEEFERRLRAAVAPQAGVEDPLAELTRLVDTIGFERTPSERALEATRPPKAVAKPTPPPASPPPPPPEILPPIEAKSDVSPRLEPQAAPLLRPSFGEAEETSDFTPPPPSGEDVIEPIVTSPPPPGQRPRGRNWGLKVGGLVAASVVMIAAVAVFKVGRGVHSGAPPLILASTAPTKVAPPSEETVRTANETGALLTRDTAQPTPTPPKLVAPPEAPVDLAARPQPTPSPTSTASASADADASPIAPASDTPIVATPPTEATPSAPVSADPSRVKTISVRPDGTLISSGFEASTAAAPPPPPSPTAVAQAADPEAGTPAPALPTKLSPPKNAARVVSKSDTTAPADEGAGPVPVKLKKPKPTPTPAAADAAPKTADADPKIAEAEPKTDDAAPVEAPAGGGYSVQLAAPNNRADADELVKKAQAKYADEIGGASLGVRKADRHGETIYRVRVVGLTRAQASAMCGKIKAAGGDCFPAKN
jgi:hypothetical protein